MFTSLLHYFVLPTLFHTREFLFSANCLLSWMILTWASNPMNDSFHVLTASYNCFIDGYIISFEKSVLTTFMSGSMGVLPSGAKAAIPCCTSSSDLPRLKHSLVAWEVSHLHKQCATKQRRIQKDATRGALNPKSTIQESAIQNPKRSVLKLPSFRYYTTTHRRLQIVQSFAVTWKKKLIVALDKGNDDMNGQIINYEQFNHQYE